MEAKEPYGIEDCANGARVCQAGHPRRRKCRRRRQPSHRLPAPHAPHLAAGTRWLDSTDFNCNTAGEYNWLTKRFAAVAVRQGRRVWATRVWGVRLLRLEWRPGKCRLWLADPLASACAPPHCCSAEAVVRRTGRQLQRHPHGACAGCHGAGGMVGNGTARGQPGMPRSTHTHTHIPPAPRPSQLPTPDLCSDMIREVELSLKAGVKELSPVRSRAPHDVGRLSRWAKRTHAAQPPPRSCCLPPAARPPLPCPAGDEGAGAGADPG